MTHEEFETIAALSAVGAATPDEMRALDEHAASCGPCRTAREEYAEAATLMAKDLDPVVPPDDLRESVLAMAGDNEPRRGGNVWWLATAATMFLALWGWREIGIRVMRERVTSQRAEIQRLTAANRTIESQREKLSGQMVAILSDSTRTIALTGQQMSPAASARAFIDPDKRRAIVFFSNLPENSGEKSYQLWVIRGGAAPESAGIFDVNRGSAAIAIENLPETTEIKGLAVTLEKHGGAPQPTSANFYVMGTT